MGKPYFDAILGKLREQDAAVSSDLETRISQLEDRVSRYHYTAISVSPSSQFFTILVGAKVNTILQNTAIAALNKSGELVSSIPGDGFRGDVTLSGQSIQVAGTLSSARNAISIGATILTAVFRDNTGEGDSTCTLTIKLNVFNNIYYGACGSTFGQSQMSSILTNTKARTLTVNASDGLYIWYAVPKRLGVCSFVIGGFAGGFELVDTHPLANANGYKEDYYLYRSQIAGLGKTTMVIS